MALSAPHTPDDGTLVLAVQRGDGEAFAELFRRHYPAVHRACCRRLSDPLEADEVAQAAFVRAFERIDQCAGERRFLPWIHVIARTMCIDAFRAQARVEPWEHPPVAEPEHRPESPEDSLLRDERAADLQQALASLPDRQRRAVIARDYHELGPGEIADRLGVTVGAVDSLLLRARRRLALAYRRRAGEGGGGATVLPVRSTAAAIVAALALAPQAVMTGTAAAAHAVQDGARRAATGVVAAVASLAVGIAGESAPAPPPPPPPAPVLADAPVAVPTTLPPVTVVRRRMPPPAPVADPVVVATPEPAVTTVPTTAPAQVSVGEAESAAVAPTVVTTTIGPSTTRPTPTTTVTTPEVTVPARPTVEVVVPTVPVVDTVPRPAVPGRP